MLLKISKMSRIYLLLSTLCFYAQALPLVHPQTNGNPSVPFIVISPFNNLQDISRQKIAQVVNSKRFELVPHFPASGRTRAVLEQVPVLGKVDAAYDQLHDFIANLIGHQPVIDNTPEHLKYGNDGGKSRQASVGIIAGVEGVSNLLNAAADAPYEIMKQVGKKFTDTLADVGSKLVG